MKVNRAGEIESKLQVNLEEILILSQISRISRIWSLGWLFRKPVAVSNMKICVIRAIREPKYKLCSTLTDITDSTDLSLGRLLME